jgi:transposase
MLSLPPSVRIFIAMQPIDGRKGADGLVALIRSAFVHDPLDGHLHVFFSRRADRVRIVYWDRDGFALWSKRLERGRYRHHFDEHGQLRCELIEAADLMLLLGGLELRDAKRRARWVPTSSSSSSSNTTIIASTISTLGD